MDLFIVRHGQAEDSGPTGNDGGRRLTEKGQRQSAAVGRVLASLDLVPDLVLSSPLIRARQTAESLIATSGMAGGVVVQEWLGLGMKPTTVMAELAALPDEIRRVVIVGHEPSFSSMISWLLGAEVGYPEVKKATLAHFQLTPPSRHGSLLKMLLPVKVLLASQP